MSDGPDHVCGARDCRVCRWMPRPGESTCGAPRDDGSGPVLRCCLARGHTDDVLHMAMTPEGGVMWTTRWDPGRTP